MHLTASLPCWLPIPVMCCLLQVRSYHASYYRPDNLAIIVVGKVTPEEVFQAISEFESKVESKVTTHAHTHIPHDMKTVSLAPGPFTPHGASVAVPHPPSGGVG